MLYITTRNTDEVFTAYHTYAKDRPEDGGFYVPFRIPVYSKDEIYSFTQKNFGQCVAEILNLFFSAGLTGWDVDFCIGKNPVKLISMSHKILIAESWHNHDWNMERSVRDIAKKITANTELHHAPTNWVWIAVRVAFLFGIFSEIMSNDTVDYSKGIDVAVPTGDFSAPVAVWYAKKMGLPIGNIICGCNDNGNLWELLHHGQMHADEAVIQTATPDADFSIPSNLERLISATLGKEETDSYLQTCEKGGVYAPNEENIAALREGFTAAVVSGKRMESVIRNVYNASSYLLGPYSALAYGSLQDYRSRMVESRAALIFTERSPLCDCATVSKALDLSEQIIRDRLGVN